MNRLFSNVVITSGVFVIAHACKYSEGTGLFYLIFRLFTIQITDDNSSILYIISVSVPLYRKCVFSAMLSHL